MIRRFPFGVFYVMDESEVVVLAVMHGRRAPYMAFHVQPHGICPRSRRNPVRIGTMNQGLTRSAPDTKPRESCPNRRKATGILS